MVKGIHHISMKCSAEELDKVLEFYCCILGMEIFQQWEGGVLLDTGAGLIEIFTNRQDILSKGVIRHFALAVDDVDECARRVKQGGYPVFLPPKDISLPCPARIAFCTGPLGEDVELFHPYESGERHGSVEKS